MLKVLMFSTGTIVCNRWLDAALRKIMNLRASCRCSLALRVQEHASSYADQYCCMKACPLYSQHSQHRAVFMSMKRMRACREITNFSSCQNSCSYIAGFISSRGRHGIHLISAWVQGHPQGGVWLQAPDGPLKARYRAPSACKCTRPCQSTGVG